MDLGEKIRQLDEQVAAAVRRALDDVRNELRSGLDQAIDDLRGKLAEVSPDLPESFFTEEALRQLAEETAPVSEDALAEARADGEGAGRDALGSELRQALAAVDRARSQNDVLQALVDESSRFASRAAVLLLRPEGLVGWVSSGFEGAAEDIRSASVAAQAEDWSTAVGGEGPRRLTASRCAQLVSQLDSPLPIEGVAIPVLLRDRVSAVFYADRATSGDHFDVAALQALVYTTALALETLAFRQREATATLEAVTGEVAPAPEPEVEDSVFELAADEEPIGLAEEPPAAVGEAPAAVEEELAAEEEELAAEEEDLAYLDEEPAAEEPLAAVEEDVAEPAAADDMEVEELELEDFEMSEPEAPEIAASGTEAPPAEEEEVEVIELPEDVGEMELETEEDQTAAWRSWKPPAAEAEPEPEPEVEEDSLLEVVDLDAGASEPTYELEVEADETELEVIETEPDLSDAALTPPAAELTTEASSEVSAEAETRTVAGFERDFELAPSEQAEAGLEEGDVELEIDDLELDADALEDLPELAPGPVGAVDEEVLELEIDEEPLAAGGAPMTEAVEPASPAPTPTAPPPAMAPTPEATVEAEPPEATSGSTTSAFAAATPDLPSGGPIEPPTDVQGPGLAFSEKGAAGSTSGDDAAHQEARRLARLLVSEIQLYNQDEVEEGRRNGDIYERLKDDIDRSRQLYEERVAPDLRESTDYFYQELVRQLGAGDAKALGI